MKKLLKNKIVISSLIVIVAICILIGFYMNISTICIHALNAEEFSSAEKWYQLSFGGERKQINAYIDKKLDSLYEKYNNQQIDYDNIADYCDDISFYDVKEYKEKTSLLSKSKENFHAAETKASKKTYQELVSLYKGVIKEDTNYSVAQSKIGYYNRLIVSNSDYEDGIKAFGKEDYEKAFKALSKVIKDDQNYLDATEKRQECVDVLKNTLCKELETYKTSNDYEKALSEIEAAVDVVQNDESIEEYKQYFEAAKEEHERLLAIEKEKQSYDCSSSSGISGFLEKFYSEAPTNVGAYEFTFKCWENDISYYGYDYEVKVIPKNDYIFADIASYSAEYTKAQKIQAKKELKNFMYTMANDLFNRTTKRIKMYYDGSYDLYEHIQGGYEYNAYCTCVNYDLSLETALPSPDDTYERTRRTGFSWYTKNDEEVW